MKRFISFLLVVLIIASCASAFAADSASLDNFKRVNHYIYGKFVDIPSGAWYLSNMVEAYELDLVKGSAENRFNPTGNMTIAEAITLASRIHSIYTSGTANFTQGTPWYQVYVNYALENNIVKPAQFSNLNVPITRAQFATIFAKALPSNELPALNNIAYKEIPDVVGTETYANAVYTLYNAGILTGSDKYGTFKPATNIQRCEVAAIATRMAKMSLRKIFTIQPKPIEPTSLSLAGVTRIDVGETVQWTVTVTPADANPWVQWISGNTGVATVDSTGKITGVANGQSNITAVTSNGIKKTVLLTVGALPPTGLNLAGKTEVYVGDTVTWTATVFPADANPWVQWISGNTGVATIDANGNITAHRAGKTNITAITSNGIKKTVVLNVYNRPGTSSDYYNGVPCYSEYYGVPDFGKIFNVSPIYSSKFSDGSGSIFIYSVDSIKQHHPDNWMRASQNALASCGFEYTDDVYTDDGTEYFEYMDDGYYSVYISFSDYNGQTVLIVQVFPE